METERLLHGRRSQAAMEFIMTYGWAILVVLAAIVALAYFGVMSPGRFLPESCTLPSTTGIACLDFKVTPVSAHVLLMNSGGRDIIINNMTAGDCGYYTSFDMPDGTSHLFNLTGCSLGSVGRKEKLDLRVVYTDLYSNFVKEASGTLTAQVS
ncbi:hypothetical protein JW898_00655 [Candidatus Woesearchaeota archaeon]|nr:hypothetical protein [Candidatus Woesearchaeota archaeon]